MLLTGQLIYLDGTLVPPERATVSVYDHGLLYGDGIHEGMRAYHGAVFQLRPPPAAAALLRAVPASRPRPRP